MLNAAPNADGVVRCGFITGKKVGKAVGRNRARRLIREAVRLRLPHLAPGWDLVWIGRARIAGATFWEVLDAVDNLLKRSRVLTVRELPYLHPQTQDGKRETRGAKREGDTGTNVERNG